MVSILEPISSERSMMKIKVEKEPIKGRKIVAISNIKKDEIVEICPLIFMGETEEPIIKNIQIGNYVFEWDHRLVMVLGFGSLYNHSYSPNLIYLRDYENELMRFVALKDINKGEELTINYNGDPNCMDPLWFEVK